MQIEPHENEDGYRCWLSESEQEMLVNHVEDQPRRELAVELMLDGLRSEEVLRVRWNDFRRLDAEQESYKLRVREGKTGWRACPVSNETRQKAKMLRSARGIPKDEPIITNDNGEPYAPRTIQRWVGKYAGPELAEQTGDNDWHHVSAHDLRRTWATSTYYSLSASPVAKDVVMRWGGWSDEQTFRENYLGREPDHVAAQLMDEAGLR